MGPVLLLAGLTVLLAGYALWYPLNHDSAWWLYIAHSIFSGADLYSTYIDVNPPLPTYISMVPVWFTMATGFPVAIISKTCVLLVLLVALVWCIYLVRDIDSGTFSGVLYAGWVIALLGLPAGDYGQREHLMLASISPYVLITWRRLLGLRIRTGQAIVKSLYASPMGSPTRIRGLSTMGHSERRLTKALADRFSSSSPEYVLVDMGRATV